MRVFKIQAAYCSRAYWTPIITAADDELCDIIPSFRKKKGMIFHKNRLPADDSYEIAWLICYF